MTASSAQPGRPARGRRTLQYRLTARHIRILALAASGHTNQEIGQHLGISHNTVAGLLQEAYGVLGARDRAHAVALCVVRGLVPGAVVEASAVPREGSGCRVSAGRTRTSQ